MKTLLKQVRLSYPSLFKASGYGDSEPKFSATMLMDEGGETHLKLMKAIEKVAKEEFGDKAKAVLKKQDDNSMRRLVKIGNEKTDDEGDVADGYADMVFMKASNKVKPKVISRAKQELTEADGKPYAGCVVNVQVDLWAQNNSYGKFINCKLLAVQFWEDGESFGGGASADLDAFDEGEDEADGEDW